MSCLESGGPAWRNPLLQCRSLEAVPRETVRPFADLGKLPDDLTEAFESFKLAILRHKSSGWQEVTLEEILGTLEALKELALAPSAD